MKVYRSFLMQDKIEPDQLSQKESLRHKRSLARSLLPNATATTLFVSANARALRHFFGLRGTIEGDYEMRQVCTVLLEKIRPDAPSFFEDFKIIDHHDGEKIISKN